MGEYKQEDGETRWRNVINMANLVKRLNEELIEKFVAMEKYFFHFPINKLKETKEKELPLEN